MQHGPSMHMGLAAKKIVAYEVAFIAKKQIAEGTYAFTFEKPKGFSFKAGQHVRMTLINPSDTDAKGNSRFLTLASTPQEKDLVVAMRMRDTAFKRALGHMKSGDKVKIEMRLDNPHGTFTLHPDDSKTAVMLVGGIGIVPAFSIIKDAIERNLPHKIILFYSNRRPEDAPFLTELEAFAKQHTRFTFIPTMTTPEKSKKAWRGEKGHIDQSLLKQYINDVSSAIYYISGMSEFVNEMKTILSGLSIKEQNIRAEEFSGFTMNHTKDIAVKNKKYLLLAASILVIAIIVILHITSLSFFATISFQNISLFTIGLLLVFVILKLVVFYKFKHRIPKLHR